MRLQLKVSTLKKEVSVLYYGMRQNLVSESKKGLGYDLTGTQARLEPCCLCSQGSGQTSVQVSQALCHTHY